MLHRAVALRVPGDGHAGVAVGVVGAVVGVALLILGNQGLVLGLDVLLGDGDVLGHVLIHGLVDRVLLQGLGVGLAAEAVVGPVLLRLGAHLVGYLLRIGVVVAQVVVDVALHGFIRRGCELGQGGLVELIQTQLSGLGLDHSVLNGAVHQVLLHGLLHAVCGKVEAVGGVLGAHGVVCGLHVVQPDHAVLAEGGDDPGDVVGIVGVHQRLQLGDLRLRIAVAQGGLGGSLRLSGNRLGLGCFRSGLHLLDGRVGGFQLRLQLGDADVGGVQLRLNVLAAAASGHGQRQHQRQTDAQNFLQIHLSGPSIIMRLRKIPNLIIAQLCGNLNFIEGPFSRKTGLFKKRSQIGRIGPGAPANGEVCGL